MNIASDQNSFILVNLTSDELNRAARLGGFTAELESLLEGDNEALRELQHLFASRGITTALTAQFEQEFPTRYPEDVETGVWETGTNEATGVFLNVWRGQFKW